MCRKGVPYVFTAAHGRLPPVAIDGRDDHRN
jgi:hypothetical protein